MVVYLVTKIIAVCRVGVTYDAEKIENLIKIAYITYNFYAIKKDIQLCIDFDSKCDKFWMYHYKKVGERDLVIANGLILKIILMIIWFFRTINKKSHLFLKNSWFVARYLSFKISISAFLVINSCATSVLLKLISFASFSLHLFDLWKLWLDLWALWWWLTRKSSASVKLSQTHILKWNKATT